MKLRLKLMFSLVVVTSVYIGIFLGSLKLIELFYAESVLGVTELLSPELQPQPISLNN